MAEGRRIVRLPTLPSWEKLLTRLSVLPETHFDQQSLRLELISLISNDANSVPQLFTRLCAFLPRITNCEGVIIWSKAIDKFDVVASNLSPRKAHSSIEPKVVQRMARIDHYFFNRRSPIKQSVSNALLTNCHSIYLGEANGQQYYLLALSSRALTGETTHGLHVVCQAIGLRLRNLSLAQNLASQKLQLNNLTQQLGEGMALLDQDLKVTLWNRALQRMTGYKTSEALGRNINEVFRRTTDPDWLETLLVGFADRELGHSHFDFEILTKQNERRWVNCLVSVYRNGGEHVGQIVLIARDISHKKILEQKKNEFISIATHELRTPLTAIKGYLSLLERNRQNLTEKQIAYLAQATKASNRLVRLAEDLLRVNQIDQERIQFRPQCFHIFPLLKKVVRDFKPKAAAKGVTLSLTSNKLYDCVRLDPERTEQIFANLIDNAIKYTEHGAIKVWLESTGDDQGGSGFLTVNIRDTGIGIDVKNIDEVFEKFHRAHRPEASREQGAGLGLYIVKSFVEKQGGKINVKSRVGKGSHFAVIFPLESPKRSKK